MRSARDSLANQLRRVIEKPAPAEEVLVVAIDGDDGASAPDNAAAVIDADPGGRITVPHQPIKFEPPAARSPGQ